MKQVYIDPVWLMHIQKPARYIGGEWNSVVKDHDSVDLHVALAFPDVYEVAMSHLGLKIIYSVINKRSDALAERVYAPWVDMEALMKEKQIPLYTLESRCPVRDFDVLGFTLPYEMCYTNVLNMLHLAGIPLRTADRTEEDPLVVAGGPVYTMQNRWQISLICSLSGKRKNPWGNSWKRSRCGNGKAGRADGKNSSGGLLIFAASMYRLCMKCPMKRTAGSVPFGRWSMKQRCRYISGSFRMWTM